ncbi:MAG: hypothetical protein ACO1QR_12220 [Chthoniobacteraceae bacterium]
MRITREAEADRCHNDLPEIVRVVLSQAARMRKLGAISESYFQTQVSRLEKEELTPRGLHLVVDDLPNGEICFSIESELTGEVSTLVTGRPRVTPLARETRTSLRTVRSRR